MPMQAAAPAPIAAPRISACAPEQLLLVASLLCMSAGFLDAVTWLSLGRVFASSQTGNVVFSGMYAVTGQWRQAAHHLVPLAGFLLGAAVAIRVRAPLFCLVGEIVCLTATMLLIHRIPDAIAILGISFGVALCSASFRQVEQKAYLSVAVTGNMLRGIDQLLAMPDVEALRGAGAMLAICLSFLLGAAVGGCLTMWLGAFSLAFPIASSTCVLLLCLRHRRRSHRG
jgi:uncharacterized membrane protein YoaK (UPF0700 family)